MKSVLITGNFIALVGFDIRSDIFALHRCCTPFLRVCVGGKQQPTRQVFFLDSGAFVLSTELDGKIVLDHQTRLTLRIGRNRVFALFEGLANKAIVAAITVQEIR